MLSFLKIKMKFFHSEKNRKALIAAAAAAVFFGLIYLYLFSPDVQLLKKQGERKVVEFSSIHIKGWDNGKQSFEISTEKASSDRDQTNTWVENIHDGKIFNENGRVILKDLRCSRAVIMSWKSIIEAYGSQEAPVRALVDISAASTREAKKTSRPEFSLLEADNLIYNTSTKKTVANKGRIISKRFSATASTIEVDSQNNKAVLFPFPVIKTSSHTITAATIENFFREEVIKGYGSSSLKIKKKKGQAEDISGDNLYFSTRNYSGSMEGNVKFRQKGKFAMADKMAYDDKKDTAILSGNVKTMIEKGSSALKGSTLKKIRNAETKKMLEDGIFLSCSSMKISTKNGDAFAEGDVRMLQKKNRAKAEMAHYNEAKETVTMTGNVRIEKEGQWLKTQKVIASLGKEEFEAIGGVETQIKVKKKRK